MPQGGGMAARALGFGAVGVSALAYGGGNCLMNVEGGHRAVMFHRFGGVQQGIKAEGTHIIIPWFMKPIIYDVRAKPRSIQSMTGSKGEASPRRVCMDLCHCQSAYEPAPTQLSDVQPNPMRAPARVPPPSFPPGTACLPSRLAASADAPTS